MEFFVLVVFYHCLGDKLLVLVNLLLVQSATMNLKYFLACEIGQLADSVLVVVHHRYGNQMTYISGNVMTFYMHVLVSCIFFTLKYFSLALNGAPKWVVGLVPSD
jgi:hypothetical protein